jgi:hypothetical protein
MTDRLKVRARIEAILAMVSAIAFLLTVLVPDWLERAFGLELDAGDGSAERAIVLVLAALTVLTTTLAVVDRRRYLRSRAVS